MQAESALLLRLLRVSGPELLVALLLAMLAGASAVGLVASAGWLITASALAGLAGVGLEIFFPGAVVRMLAVSRTVSRYGERLLGHAAIFTALARLRLAVFSGLCRLPLIALSQRQQAVDLQRLMHHIERLEAWPVRVVLPLGALLASTLLCAGLVSLALGWQAGGIAAAVLLGCWLTLLHWPERTRRKASRINLLRQRHAAAVTETLQCAAALWHIDPHGRRPAHCQRLLARGRQSQLIIERRANRREAGQQLALGLLAVVLMAAWPIASPAWHLLAVLSVVALAGLLPGIALSTAGMAGLWVSARAVLEQRDSQPSATDRTTVAGAPALRFARVRVETGWLEPALFDRFDWHVQAGEWWAVCGPSGSGKSTLARLLAGLQEAEAGQAEIDGHPVASLADAARLDRMAFLTQDTVIVADTLRRNLTLGCRRPVEEQQLIEALEQVGLEELTTQLDRWLGPTGQPLSGGQARRVALIRAVLSDAPGLVLDEPFRGLDDVSRRRTAQWLWAQARGRTLLLLDHSPPPNWPGRVLDVSVARSRHSAGAD